MQFLNYVTRVTSLLALYSREKTVKFNCDLRKKAVVNSVRIFMLIHILKKVPD